MSEAGMPPSPVNVLLWSGSGSGEHYSGPASFTYRLYSDACPSELKVSLAHAFPAQETYPLFQEQHCLGDVWGSTLSRTRLLLDARRWLNEHAHRFDVMHSLSGFHYSVSPSYHAEKLGLPAVLFVTNHMTQLARARSWRGVIGLHRQRQRMLRDLSAVVAMSQDIHDELLSYGVAEERIARIPMGVNTAVFHPVRSVEERSRLRTQYGWPDRPTILFVGTVVRRKRPDVLIGALAELKARRLDCQLVIAGPEKEPEYSADIRQHADTLGVSDRVIWHGFTSEVAPLYRAAELFCLPSANEGMAAALIEAMASGLVPLVTPISGSSDVVEHGTNGQHIKAEASDIAGAISLYLKDEALTRLHAERSLAIVQASYSTSAVLAAYQVLFRRLVAGKAAR